MAAIVELRYGQKISEHAEHIASRVGGSLLFALANLRHHRRSMAPVDWDRRWALSSR